MSQQQIENIDFIVRSHSRIKWVKCLLEVHCLGASQQLLTILHLYHLHRGFHIFFLHNLSLFLYLLVRLSAEKLFKI